MKFTELQLHENLQKAIDEVGFTECTPAQELSYRETFEGRDVFVQSQTGTGKTAAFLIAFFKHYLDPECKFNKKALVIAPTRELAVQIEDEARLLGKHLDIKVGSFYGGIGYARQEKLLAEGVDLVIGTPGRLIDFGKSKKINFREFGFVVIDEADRLFDMGFLPDLRKMLKQLRPAEERLTMLFSATLNISVQNIAWEYMNAPVDIAIKPESITVEEITQELYHVAVEDKMKILLGLLQREKPSSAVIFTNTKNMAVQLAKRLGVNGYTAEFLMGDLPQRKRLSIIKAVKEGRLQILVATDVAARGLHIDDLDLVVNYDIPEDYENYVHRIGRTARAGKSGKALTLACERFVYGLEAIEKFIGMKIPVCWLEEGAQVEDKSAGMRFENEYARDNRSRDGRSRDGRSRDGRSRDGRSRDGRSRDGRSGERYSRDDRSGRSGQRDNRRRDDRSGGRRPSDTRRPDGGRRPDPRRSEGSRSRGAARPEGARPAASRPAGPSRKRNQKVVRRPVESDQQKRPVNPPNAPKKSAKSAGRPDNRGKAPQKPAAAKSAKSNSRVQGNLDERLAYYKAKYGEDFQVAPDVIKNEKKAGKGGKGLFGRMKGMFRKK